jgi:hypothetical protein
MEKKPKVNLIGKDGNAFVIIGSCKTAWRKANGSVSEWEKIQKEMMSGDYNNLLQVAMNHFDIF